MSEIGIYDLPAHTQESLRNYILYGMHPGGFISALLAGDLFRIVTNADTTNRHYIWQITRWVMFNAPEECWGNYAKIDDWCSDKDGIRSAIADRIDKKFTWQVLSGVPVEERIL